MPVFLGADRRVLFVHVPKTGGTSVERLFSGNGYRMSLRDGKVGKESVNWVRRCSPQHLHAAMLSEMLLLDRFDLIFMLARDPLARFRSEYSMRHRDDLRTDAETVSRWTERVFDRYGEDPYLFDNHLRPQSEFRLPATEVYRLEDGLEAMVSDLNARFGLDLPAEVPHAMNRAKASGVASRDVEISEATSARVRDFYRADYEAFGY